MTPEIATRERLSELTVLSRLAERAGEAVTEGALLDGALDDLRSLLEEDFALACVVDEGEKVLRLASHQGLPGDVAAALARRPFPLGQGVLGEAAKSGRLVVLDDGDCRARVVAPGLR
ncbi:MAG: hypothetical protein HY614_01895, partial [Candidatus Rokubacteria bacterium]|nr:hypothetical protein [Candidatus Rokubacteria bacterium]